MTKPIHAVVALVALPLLSGCLSITINEDTAFAPPKRALVAASSISELQSRWADGLRQREANGVLSKQTRSDGALQLTFLKPLPDDGQISPTMIVRHGFIGEGARRVAWSLFTSQETTTRPLVVHCAGNGGDRYNSSLNYAAKAMPWADVLVFDYPGYGDTPGPVSAAAFEAVSTSVAQHAIALSQDRKLVFWGQSLGGFVCSRLASQVPQTDGLILETTAPSAAAVAKAWTPIYARPFVRTSVVPSLAQYDVVALSAQVRGPVLVLGATKDEVLPVTLARQLGDGLKSRNVNVTYQEYPDAKHMNVPAQAGFSITVANFFKTVESQP